MATISVLVGQCGNQLGTELYTMLAGAAEDSRDAAFQHGVSTEFFRRPPTQADRRTAAPTARAVLVDMEPKVIDDCRAAVARDGRFVMGADACVTREEGSANNWAFGYFKQGRSRCAAILDSVRREVEHADAIGAFHVVHSVAGGTGSGVGCLISDTLREAYPHIPLMHSVVWPFSQGEVVTQWFNTLLTMHVLDESADSVLVLSNDDAQRQVQRATAGGAGVAGAVTYRAINDVLATQLSALYLPRLAVAVPEPMHVERRSKALTRAEAATVQEPRYSSPACSSDAVAAVALNPLRTFFQARCAPVPIYSAGDGSRRSETMSSSWSNALGDVLHGRSGTEASLLVLRGDGSATDGVSRLSSALHQHPVPVNALQVAAPRLLGLPCHAALFHNSDGLGAHVAHCAERVETLTSARAFVHHYERYGVEVADLEDAVLHGWNIAENYGFHPAEMEPDDAYDDTAPLEEAAYQPESRQGSSPRYI